MPGHGGGCRSYSHTRPGGCGKPLELLAGSWLDVFSQFTNNKMSPDRSAALFIDYASQPSRACAILCRVQSLPVKEEKVLIGKKEHRGAEHLARNPLGKLPALEVYFNDGSPTFRLQESAAILSYLCDTFSNKVPEHWLPRSSREARAKVEAALHWYHGNLRAGAAKLVMHRVLAARLGITPSEAMAQEGLHVLKRSLNELQSVWLQGGALPFIGGAQPCVADLLCACELEQLTLLNKELHGVDMPDLLDGKPVIRRWMAATAAATAPHYEQVHGVLRQMAQKGQGTQSPSQQLPIARL